MGTPTIVISSRRNTTREIALRLNETLTKLMPGVTVFNGVEKISAPGKSLLDAIPTVASSCDALLVIIGSDWVSDTAWLANPRDFNRSAIVAAMSAHRKVIPVLVDGAAMPASSLFTAEMAPFGNLPSMRLNAGTFESDTSNIVQAMNGKSSTVPAAAPKATVPASQPIVSHNAAAPSAPTRAEIQPTAAPAPVAITTPQPSQAIQGTSTNIAAQVSQSIDAVIGQTVGSQPTTLYQLPNEKSQVRTQISSITPIVVLARDKDNQWLSVIHVSSTQQQLLGWVHAKNVEHLSFKGRSVMMLDLNISEYEHNTHDEIVEFIKLQQKELTVPGLKAFGLTLVAFIAFGAIASMLDSNDGGLIGLGVGLAILIYAWVMYNKDTAQTRALIEKLEAIRKKKRSATQVASEAAAAATKKAIGTAIGIAALIGTAAVLKNSSTNNNTTKRRP